MTPGLIKMWISFSSMAFMVIAVFSIYLSRYKVKNKFFKIILSIIAYSFIFLAGIIVLFVVFSGPTNG